MIVVKLQGGLCNQVFQWAYGYALSKKLGKELFLDCSFYNQNCSNCTPRNFELHNFPNLDLQIFENEAIPLFFEKPVFKITDNHLYQDIDIETLSGNLLLDGYFQSEEYFKSYRGNILKLLDLRTVLPNIDYDFSDSCSLHVRRTDYLNLPKYHLNLNLKYYEEALEKLQPSGKLYVFSDDISWCKNVFKFPRMHFIENDSAIEDLYLMSLCSNNIIANSSFSWWGAWLNKNQNKIVVSPSTWFGPDGPPYINLIPESWTQIDLKL
jgi:hypothetical protein